MRVSYSKSLMAKVGFRLGKPRLGESRLGVPKLGARRAFKTRGYLN